MKYSIKYSDDEGYITYSSHIENDRLYLHANGKYPDIKNPLPKLSFDLKHARYWMRFIKNNKDINYDYKKGYYLIVI